MHLKKQVYELSIYLILYIKVIYSNIIYNLNKSKYSKIETKKGIFNLPPKDIFFYRRLENEKNDHYKFLSFINKIYNKECSNKNNSIIIGAHIGSFLIPISKDFDKNYAFEANPGTFKILNENLKLNNINNVLTYNVGVDDKQSKRKFLINKINTGGSKFPLKNKSLTLNIDQSKEIEIETTIVDNLNIKFDFALIDVEGNEINVFKGMQKSFKDIQVLVTELSFNHLEKNNQNIEDFFKYLSVSFSRYYIYNYSNKFNNIEETLNLLYSLKTKIHKYSSLDIIALKN